MELKLLSDSELAKHILSYIDRAEILRNEISSFIEGKGVQSGQADNIKTEYKNLKAAIREDAHYLGLQCNSDGSSLYMFDFKPSIREASACGFNVSTAQNISRKMFFAVSEAHFQLTQYKTREEWKKIASAN